MRLPRLNFTTRFPMRGYWLHVGPCDAGWMIIWVGPIWLAVG